MRKLLLGFGCLSLACACGGSDFTSPEGGTYDGGDGGTSGGEGGGDGAGGDGLGTFVSGATGNDANLGTKLSPVKTIAKGIANAQTIGVPRTVYVAGSHYPEKVTLVEGVTLEGGYECNLNPCTWALDPVKNDTAILDQDFEGVLADTTITRATRMSGFRIQGMNGQPNVSSGAVALTIKGSPTISRNRVNGADVNGGVPRTVAIAVLAPIADPNGPLIENNDVSGGPSTGESIGVLFSWIPNPPNNSTSSGLVRNNRIVGGTANNNSFGVLAWSTAGNAALAGNAITAGTSKQNGNLAWAWGVGIGGTLLVDANVINGDQNAVGGCSLPNVWCGGLVSLSSTSVITNNVIYGLKGPRSAAVLLTEAEKAAGLVILNGNTLDGAGSGLSNNFLTRSAAVALRIVVGTNGVFGKIRNDILLGGQNQNRYGIFEEEVPNKTNKPQARENNDFFFPQLQGRNDVFWHEWDGMFPTDVLMVPPTNNLNVDPQLDASWHLKQGSGCIDKGTPTEAPAKDRDGDNRPNGQAFDIGADEYK